MKLGVGRTFRTAVTEGIVGITGRNEMTKDEKIKSATKRVELLCQERGFDSYWVRSKSRRRPLPRQRRELIFHLRAEGFSYPVIGRVFNRDHSSIIAAERKYRRNEK